MSESLSYHWVWYSTVLGQLVDGAIGRLSNRPNEYLQGSVMMEFMIQKKNEIRFHRDQEMKLNFIQCHFFVSLEEK